MGITTLPYDVIPQVFNKFNRTQIGKKVKGAIFPGGLDAGSSQNPKHTFNMQGAGFRSELTTRPFRGGKQVRLINVVTITDLATKTLVFKLNGKTVKTLTFVASGATTNQINIGVDEAATETNIQTKLNGLVLSSKTTLVAAIDTGKVKVTGSAFESLTITSSDTDNVTVENGTDTAATLPIVFAGSIFVPNTLNTFRIGLPTTDALGKTKNDRIVISTLTPAGITTAEELVDAIEVVFTKALAGDAPFDADGNRLGYVFSENERLYSEISTALQSVFGATIGTCFTGSTTGFTLTVVQSAYLGLPGNGLQIDFNLEASELDGDIFIDANDTILFNGVAGKSLGSTTGYESNSSVTTGTVPQDSGDLDYGTEKTGIQQTVKILVNDVHGEAERYLAAAATSLNETHDISMPGGGQLGVVGIAVLIDSPVLGQKHFEFANIKITGSKAYKGSKSSTDGLEISGSVEPLQGTANPGLVKYTFRQAGQA